MLVVLTITDHKTGQIDLLCVLIYCCFPRVKTNKHISAFELVPVFFSPTASVFFFLSIFTLFALETAIRLRGNLQYL